MHLSVSGKHDAVHRPKALHISSPKLAQHDYRQVLLEKMSELNTSANNQHQLAAGLAAYENFCGNDSNMPINSAKQPQHPQLRSRQMNGVGQPGGDSPLSPTHGSWQDPQSQAVRLLQQELEERKRNEAHLHQMIRALRQQHQAAPATNLDQVNGASLTPDGLPAAPSSDGIVESVKDGHIRRLGRELTVLKAKLHDTEAKLTETQKERDLARQQVGQLLSEQRLSNATSAAGEKEKETLDRQRAEISTLKESVQRLSRENQCLKESAAVLSSRQSGSLGATSSSSSPSSSVAGCSQELDYLHKVVDTLRATVQEQHAKLWSLRPVADKNGRASGSAKAQSFPVMSRSPTVSSSSSPAAGSVRGPTVGASLEDSERSVDGVAQQHGILHDFPVSTATTPAPTFVSSNSNNLSGSSSSRSNQAVQDDETVNRLGQGVQKLVISGDKPIPGVTAAVGRTAPVGKSSTETVDNPAYFMAPQANVNWGSQGKPATVSSGVVVTSAWGSATTVGSPHMSQSQVIGSRKPEVSTAPVGSSPMSRLLSRSEIIGVSNGVNRPSVSRSGSTHAAPAALSSDATVQRMLEALGGASDPAPNPVAVSTSASGGIPNQLSYPQRLPAPSGMIRPCLQSAAVPQPRLAQPQFVYEAEVEDRSETYPVAVGGPGGPDFQRLTDYSQIRQPPPPQPHQAMMSSSSSSPMSPLSTYQTASSAVMSDREGMRILNKHMMGGGNMIYQQNAQLLQPQQVNPFVAGTSPVASAPQNTAFTAQAVSAQGLPYPCGGGDHQTVYSNAGAQQLDPSGPRVNSDRACPVCGQDFSHVPMEDFQAHVYECFDEAGPETMKAPEDQQRSPGRVGAAPDRTCPVCNASFEAVVPQAEFERHVHSHFGEENFEIVS